jgi:hypothetical protein
MEEGTQKPERRAEIVGEQDMLATSATAKPISAIGANN